MKPQLFRGTIVLLALLLPVSFGIRSLAFAAAAVDVANKTCPVTGEKIEKPYNVEQDGKNVSLCCKMCLKDFKKNPETLTQKATQEAAQ